ncbi:MAG: metallophosphoesterase family protein, partial [Chitinivibrionales bacterium]
LGDIVGYYPDPEGCLELVKDRASYSVAGNHDYAAAGKIDISNFTYYAFAAMEWTRKQLSQDSIEYLGSLPLSIRMDSIFFTHSSPADPDKFTYIFFNSASAISDAFSSMVNRINFIGHTHWPFVMVQEDDGVLQYADRFAEIDPEKYYLVNVGSVGQPRNMVPYSSYAIYDTNEQAVSIINVDYDYTVTQDKVLDNGLPEFLAQRLSIGK